MLAGCGHSTPGANVVTVTRTDDVGAAYDAALAGLDPPYFDGMERSSPDSWRQVLLVPADGSDQMLAEWEGYLAAGAARARLTHPSRLSRVDVFEHAAGEAVPSDAEYGYRVTGHPVSSPASDSELEAGVASVLREFHLTPTSVRVLHPLGPAVVVEATAPSAASVDGRMGQLESALASSKLSGIEGLYVAVDGPDGPLFRGESAERIAEGGQWFADGFDSGIPHG
ncbi:MAG: hypothetical protein QOH37_1368 [Nocardioidaceae bacterium]|nr:hypothetical protein [Nocardioidaceae bacterium]